MTSARRARLVAAVLVAAATSLAPAAQAEREAVPPRLHQLLAGARTVVSGRVAAVRPYDSGRVVVAEIAVDETLKGEAVGSTVRVVELRSLPSAPVAFVAREHVLAFLAPAARTSYLRGTLPAGEYLQAPRGREGVLSSGSEVVVDEAAAIVARIVAASREPEPDREKRREAARALVFDELAARHPAVVEDGIAGLAALPSLEPLGNTEELRVEALIARGDLPARVRERAFTQVAALGIDEAVPALRRVDTDDPAVLAAAWDALRRLGAAPEAKVVAQDLRSDDPALRAAAARELLARGTHEIPRVADVALHDPDPAVRAEVLDALADTGSPDALPTLERGFADPEWSVRHAAGRAIFRIGGRDAAEALARLTFAGAPEVQRYAVTLLRATGVADDDPLLVKIRKQHPDPQVREQAEHGLPFHEH